MITFEQVTKRYGERLALDSVSWHMDEGDCVVVVGHSGAGKTSLLRLITHEIQPTSGTIAIGTFRGGRLSRPQRALLRRTLGIIYEDFRLLNDRTVFENVALAVRITGRFNDREVIPRVVYALEEVGLQSKQAAFPHELSAGEKQRAAIARAIVNRPAVILADEPSGALEPKSAAEVLNLLKRIHGEGAAVLLVTTREEVARHIGGRILHLEDGRLTGDLVPASHAAAAGASAAPAAAETSSGSGVSSAAPPAQAAPEAAAMLESGLTEGAGSVAPEGHPSRAAGGPPFGAAAPPGAAPPPDAGA